MAFILNGNMTTMMDYFLNTSILTHMQVSTSGSSKVSQQDGDPYFFGSRYATRPKGVCSR